ncbi:MAG: glycosyltransferase [Nannocystaceae bacterium]
MDASPPAEERAPRRGLVLVPTYNERDNLAAIVGAIHAAVPELDVLVIDDRSPDGTGELADALAAADPRVFVLHRPGKEGLGRAYVDGMRWGLRAGGGLPPPHHHGRRLLPRSGAARGAPRGL